jgi:hypothetical protein
MRQLKDELKKGGRRESGNVKSRINYKAVARKGFLI